jgi:cobalt-zinc-cadmium efflux system outer membrane protein
MASSFRPERFALVALFLVLGACATVPEEAGFSDAAALVQERSGLEIRWNRGTPEDAEVAARVSALLARELDAEAAVAIALFRNRHLQALYEDLRIAQADLVEAGLLRNPIFHFEGLFPEGGGRMSLDLGLEQEFLSILYLPLRKRVAAASFEATKLRVAEQVLALAGEVRMAFYRLQGAEQLAELMRTVLQATEAASDLAQRLHEAGNIRDLDLANELALHEESKLALAQAELERTEARERLDVLMGLWGPEAGWKLAPRLPELPAEDVSVAGIEARAVTASLGLAQRRIEIEREAERLGFVRQTRLAPDPALGIGAERDSESGLWTVGPALALSLPLFDQGQPAVARAVALLSSLQESYAAEAIELRSAVRSATSRVLAMRGRADFLRRVIVPLRGRIVEETQLEYNAMQQGAFQLLMAKREEIAAGAAYVAELRDYWIASAGLAQILAGAGPTLQQFSFEEARPLTSRSLSTDRPIFFLQAP